MLTNTGVFGKRASMTHAPPLVRLPTSWVCAAVVLVTVSGCEPSSDRLIVGWHAAVEPNWRIPTPPVWLGVAFSAALLAFALARGRWSRAASGAAVAALLRPLVWDPF